MLEKLDFSDLAISKGSNLIIYLFGFLGEVAGLSV